MAGPCPHRPRHLQGRTSTAPQLPPPLEEAPTLLQSPTTADAACSTLSAPLARHLPPWHTSTRLLLLLVAAVVLDPLLRAQLSTADAWVPVSVSRVPLGA